jgi:hypothetical protein
LDIKPQESPDIPRDLLFKSALNGRFKFLPAFVYGEFGVLGISSTLDSFNVVDSQVESASQIVDNIPEDHIDGIGTLIMFPYLEKIARAIRIMLYEGNMEMAIQKPIDLIVQVRDVLFGPFNL